MSPVLTTLLQATGTSLPVGIATVGAGPYAFLALGLFMLTISTWFGILAADPTGRVLAGLALLASLVIALCGVAMILATGPAAATTPATADAMDDGPIVTDPWCAFNVNECFTLRTALDYVPRTMPDTVTDIIYTDDAIVEYDCDDDGVIDTGGKVSELGKNPCTGGDAA